MALRAQCHPRWVINPLGVLKELACRQILNEAAIRRQEVVSRQILELDPLELVKDAIDQIAGKLVYREELQINGAAVAIVMPDVGHSSADLCGNTEFLVQLARQCLFCALTGLDFPPGELPLQSHGLVRTALANQNLAAPDD